MIPLFLPMGFESFDIGKGVEQFTSGLGKTLESLNGDILKPVKDFMSSIMVAISSGSSGLLKPFIDAISSFTENFTGKPSDAAEAAAGSSDLMKTALKRLDQDKLMGFRSPAGSVGCADFVSFALGLHRYENGQQIKNTAVLKNPNTNTRWVPDLVKEFRAQKFKEITDPVAIHKAIQDGLPVGGIVILGNSYTFEDEDHIGIAVRDKSGKKTVVLNNGGHGTIRERTDLMAISDPDKIRSRQEAFKKSGRSNVKRDPVVTKIFLPSETA